MRAWVRRMRERAFRTFGPLIERLVQVGLVPSAVVLAAQTFMALFPLLMAITAIAPAAFAQEVAETLRDRVGISGESGQSVNHLVSGRGQLRGAVTVFGVLVVLASATSFTRALQRLYEAAWQLPKLGLRGTVRGLVWLLSLMIYFTIAAVLLWLITGTGPVASPLRWLFTAVSAVVLWWWTPFLLLGGRVRARALLPGALLTATALLVLGKIAGFYLPRTIHSQERLFGSIGVVFAIESWLVVLACAIVGAAVVSAVAAQLPGPVGRLARGELEPDAWRRVPGRRRRSRRRGVSPDTAPPVDADGPRAAGRPEPDDG